MLDTSNPTCFARDPYSQKSSHSDNRGNSMSSFGQVKLLERTLDDKEAVVAIGRAEENVASG